MRKVTQNDGRPIAETKTLMLRNFENEVTSIMFCHSFYVAVVKSVMNLCAVLEKEYGMSTRAVRRMDIVEDIVFSGFLNSNSFQTYERYLQVAIFFLKNPIILNILENIDVK